MAYTVTSPLVSVKDPAGKSTYFYEGSIVPDGFDKADVERLAAEGLIEAIVSDQSKPAARSAK